MKSLFVPIAFLFAAAAAETAGGGGATPEAAAKPAREKQNGVTRPAGGTQTGKVWEIADSISTANGRPATRAEVTDAGAKAGINPATVTTQFGQWRRFYGIKKEATVPAAEGTAKPKKGKRAAAATESNVPDGGVAVTTTEGGEVEPVAQG